ncbi:MAG: hypothetical protein WC657_00410 [Candidatus Paceibacterota bacterium]|jgi:hypothetical protein
MTKKILLVLGILVIIGIAVFFMFFSKPQTEGESGVGFSIRNFLPFGSSDNIYTSTTTPDINTDEKPSDQINSGTVVVIPRLRKLSNEPVAGAVIFNIGTTSIVRFVEKGTGNVYEAKSNSLTSERLTNTTIPKIIRAFWLPDASGFLAQTLLSDTEIIETNFVKLNKNKASTTLENLTPFSTTVSKLPTDIKEMTVKPDSTKIFYYTINNSYSNWFTANPDGTKATLVMNHPLTEWLPKWISGNTVIMQSKGSAEILGFTYTFDVSSMVLKKIGMDSFGISNNTKPDSSLSLVSMGGIIPQLSLVDNKNVTLKVTGVTTLAEKCVWLKDQNPTAYCAISNNLPRGNYPDDWYKGLISTEDFIQKIDINNDIFYKTADLTNLSKQKIDITDISLSSDETHLIFRNKIDGYLWMLRIGE